MSVTLVYTHGETVKAQFMEAVLHAKDAAEPGSLLVFGQPGAEVIANCRNDAVRRFLLTEMEWLWFVDADVVVQPGTLPRLLEVARGSDVVAAAYWRRSVKDGNVTTWVDENLQRVTPTTGLVEIGGCGMGCTMINVRVLKRLAVLHPDDPWPWFGHDLVHGMRVSEDYTFCHRARLAGFKIHGACDVVVAHYKLQAVPPPVGWGVEVLLEGRLR